MRESEVQTGREEERGMNRKVSISEEDARMEARIKGTNR